IKNALASVKIASTFPVIFRDVGFFPNAKRARVFWAGIEAGGELADLAGKVAACLEPLGI
ncbi:MAG: 2'-5' RNA ligase family protein, partial [Bryobacteraceae bacterium]